MTEPAAVKRIELNNGASMPAFGLGTWKSKPGEVGRAVVEAVKAGYRHIDCAWIYGNEAEIGEALAGLFDEGVVQRDDLWVTSKLWNNRHAPADVEPGIRETLEALKLERLDLYLMHWPVALRREVVLPAEASDLIPLPQAPLADTWAAMENLVDAGLTRCIGVSNFSVPKLRALLEHARIPPANNQIELHPYLRQAAMLEFCREANIAVTAYSPLGSRDRVAALKTEGEPVLLEDPAVAAIAEAHGVSPAQVLIAWALTRGTMVIPKSVDPGRIRQNLAATSIELRAEDMASLDALDRHRRYVDGRFWSSHGGPYSLSALWDE